MTDNMECRAVFFMAAKKNDEIRPMPELLVPEKWTVVNGRVPQVNRSAHHMEVPLEDTAQAAQARAHEMAHVRWSPTSYVVEGVDDSLVQVAEEARIHRLMKDAGVGTSVPMLTGWRSAKLAEEWDLLSGLDQAKMVVASLGTGDETLVRDLYDTEDRYHDWSQLHYMADYYFNARSGSWSATVELAQWLQEEAGNLNGEASDEYSEGDGDSESDGPQPEALPNSEQILIDYLGGKEPSETPVPGNVWGIAEIRNPHLSVSLPMKLRHRKTVSVEDGLYMRRPERWVTDKRIFGMRFHRTGRATVLIDVSGSMHLTDDQIREVVEALPGSLVAMYSGADSYGHITVVARKGRRVANLYEHRGPGGNVVDGPALRWLGEQDGPRYWVCDGCVTGRGDNMASNLTYEALQLMRKGKIVRLDNMAQVLKRAKIDRVL